MNSNPQYIYKILTQAQWNAMKDNGLHFQHGSELDIKDGYLHLSTAKQIESVAQKYFPNLENGILLQIDYHQVESSVKWEPSSTGELYPHIYGMVPIEVVAQSYDFNTNGFNFKSLAL